MKNKSGFWESTDSWSLPSEEVIKGIITNSTKSTVLSVISNDTEQGTAVIEDILVPNDVRQIWIKGKSRPYFTLLNPNSGKYLTASPTCLTIEGKVIGLLKTLCLSQNLPKYFWVFQLDGVEVDKQYLNICTKYLMVYARIVERLVFILNYFPLHNGQRQ